MAQRINDLNLQSTHTDIAILIFARTPEDEARHKKWIAGTYQANVEFSERLTAHTLQLAEKSGLPFCLYHSAIQKGNNFAERLSNSCKDLFSKGFRNILVIGNDTTGLGVNDLKNAAERLSKGQFVLGPSTDGGIYLLGLSQEHFSKINLSETRWESSLVLQDLQLLASKAEFSVFFLEKKHDLDGQKDFQLFLKAGAGKTKLGKLLLALIPGNSPIPYEYGPLRLTQVSLSIASSRAPPL